MACRLAGAKPLSGPMLEYFNWTLRNKLQWNLNRNSLIFIKKMYLKMSSGNLRPFCLGLNVLTLLELQPEYSGWTRSIPWLLIPWLPVLPGKQNPRHWLGRINGSLFSIGEYFNYHTYASWLLRNDYKCSFCFLKSNQHDRSYIYCRPEVEIMF